MAIPVLVADVLAAAYELIEGDDSGRFLPEVAQDRASACRETGDAQSTLWLCVQEYLLAYETGDEEQVRANERSWRSRTVVEWPVPPELEGSRFIPLAGLHLHEDFPDQDGLSF